jgi:hypothetical protein
VTASETTSHCLRMPVPPPGPRRPAYAE